MSAIRLGAAANVRDFQSLLSALSIHKSPVLDDESLRDEFGRFRVWTGNLGVLQKGHSSLDYRLRDAPLLSAEVSKLLKELEENLHAAHDIIAGIRLPYEQQQELDDYDGEGSDEDPSSEDEDETSDSAMPRSELRMRYHEVIDIIDNLYKISVRIRTPTARTRSLKAATYNPKDLETGVDLFDQYAIFDLHHTQELIRHLRTPHVHDEKDIDANGDLIIRLARGVTLRRRQFKYWRRHRDKLGISTISEEPQAPAALPPPGEPHRQATLEVQPGTLALHGIPELAPSQKTGKTLLSGTEATHHHQSLDDIVDSKSVTSYAVTVKDLSGKGIDLPPPPRAAEGDRDFECPYCFIICPARYGKGRPWRTHVLQDLQPYVCTYSECQIPEQLFRSRRDWIEHEGSHRKAWRCPEHPDAVYKSNSGLEDHFRIRHGESIHENQIASLVKVGETNTIDQRQKCPLCLVSADTEGIGTLQDHIANHLERIAAFSLPIEVDGESDGSRSSRASRGETEGSAIHFASESSNSDHPSAYDEMTRFNDNDVPTAYITNDIASPSTDLQEVQIADDPHETLTQALVQTLPDDSGNRTDLLLAVSTEEEHRSDEDPGLGGSREADNIAEEDLAEVEDLRVYLGSQPGIQVVSLSIRGDRWYGTIRFKDGEFAAMALRSFDMAKFPRVQIYKKHATKDALEFSVPRDAEKTSTLSRPQVAAVNSNPLESLLPEPYPTSIQGDAMATSPVLTAADIPNLSSLYRSEEILPQDVKVCTPNDAYNEIVSFCYYDITRLKVDAILNSCNQTLIPSRGETTLNRAIHDAAGSGLEEECSSVGKLQVAQSVITSGHKLPSTHIIHIARPRYPESEGAGRRDLLAQGYRGAMGLAMSHGLKTVAFCCLGTGWVGIPARFAARIALRETREFLETHPTHGFERIIFCVYKDDDSAVYIDSFPLFFPPTSDDLAIAASNRGHVSHTRFLALTLNVSLQVNNTIKELKRFDVSFADTSQSVVQGLSAIAILIDDCGKLISHPIGEIGKLYWHSMNNAELLCSVLLAACINITGFVELANEKEDMGLPDRQAMWQNWNVHMKKRLDLDVIEVVLLCEQYAWRLVRILEHNAPVPQEMKTMGAHLSAWLAGQHSDSQRIRDDFEEALLSRQYRPKAAEKDSPGIVKLHEIPTLTQLYKSGVLRPKNTRMSASSRSNSVVCLAKEDITHLEIDIIVNSTDEHFSGLGGLDRRIFRRGGIDLEKECANHAPCNEGEVILTGGYSLPVKHILHAIPPAIYQTETSHVLRDMYRKILHMASYLKATSIAIPALGTGMLEYPRRDAAVIAIEEVKTFLESVDESNPIERIVLVVFSSSDEFVYKSLIPIYFPAPNSPTEPDEPSSPPTRTILKTFGTLGDTFRKISSSKKQSVTPIKQPLRPSEEDILINFETHAQTCPICSNMSAIYAVGKDICDDGYRLAAQVLRLLHMRADRSVYLLRSEGTTQEEVDVPDIFPLTLELLRIVEESFRDPDRDRPFVSNQPALGKLRRPGYTVYKMQIIVSFQNNQERPFSRIHVWSGASNEWENFQASEPTLHLTRGSLVIREGDDESVSESVTGFPLDSQSTFTRSLFTEILVDRKNAEKSSAEDLGSRLTLKFQSNDDREMLLKRMIHTAYNSDQNSWSETQQSQDTSTEVQEIFNTDATVSPHTETEAHVSYWEPSRQIWKSLSHYAAYFHITSSLLVIVTSEPSSTGGNHIAQWRLKLTPLTIVRRHSDLEILVDNVITQHELVADTKRYMLKCSSSSDCDILLLRLTQAIETSSYEPGESSAVDKTSSEPELNDDFGFRPQLEAMKQLWKTDEENPEEQVPTQSDAERELVSTQKEDSVDSSGVPTANVDPSGS